MKRLNMEEKKKLEKLIESEIGDAEVLVQKRLEFLKEGLVSEPVQAVEEFMYELKDIEKDKERIETALKKLHYYLHYNGELNVDLEHPKLKACKEEQKADFQRLKTIRREFIVKLYSEQGGMEEVLAELNKTIAKIVS